MNILSSPTNKAVGLAWIRADRLPFGARKVNPQHLNESMRERKVDFINTCEKFVDSITTMLHEVAQQQKQSKT